MPKFKAEVRVWMKIASKAVLEVEAADEDEAAEKLEALVQDLDTLCDDWERFHDGIECVDVDSDIQRIEETV